MLSIADEVERVVRPGTVIPKPQARAEFRVEGWRVSRGERALVYSIPNHADPSNPHKKRIRRSDFEQAYERLIESGELRSSWFKKNMPVCANDGMCNFTTIGGIFILLKHAIYDEQEGGYRHVRRSGTPSPPAHSEQAVVRVQDTLFS